MPRKDIEAAESEAASLQQRAAAIGAGLSHRDALVAPVSGVIASASVVAGQVVDARELLFEVIDPTRLRVEALAFDTAIGADIADAAIAVGDARVPLAFVGAARSLRTGAAAAVPARKARRSRALAVGQSVQVFVRSKQTVTGIAVPSARADARPAEPDHRVGRRPRPSASCRAP